MKHLSVACKAKLEWISVSNDAFMRQSAKVSVSEVCDGQIAPFQSQASYD